MTDAGLAAPRRRGRPRKDARPPGTPSTKELILRAAAEAFAERGFEGASLVEIAGAAGVTTGAVYSHFSGKPELLLQVVSSTLDAIDPLRRAGATDGPEVLHAWLTWLLAPEQTDLRALITEINHAAIRDREVGALLLAYSTQYATIIAELVRRWQREGLVRGGRSPGVVAQLFLAEAAGLCSSSAFAPDVVGHKPFRDLVHGQIACLLGEH